MSESWTWAYQDADGETMGGPGLVATSFPTQVDAEAWLAGTWESLADAGVEGVSLFRDDHLVYGPMSLHAG